MTRPRACATAGSDRGGLEADRARSPQRAATASIELFDLAHDPAETRNLAARASRGGWASFWARLDAWWSGRT